MSEFYDGLSATASRLLARFGRTVTLERNQSLMHDPVTGEVQKAKSSIEVKSVILPATSSKLQDLDNSLSGDNLAGQKVRYVILEAKSGEVFEPKTGDHLCFDSERWLVRGATPVNPAGTAVIYKAAITQ